MNKHISDYLPATVVRDLRQSIRNSFYRACLLLSIPAALWILLGSPQGNGYLMAGLAIVLMWFIIPNRAGAAVTADAKVKSTNFMILTPLTSRCIVWGIWLSAAIQIVIMAAVGALLLVWRHHLPAQAELTPDLRMLDWMVYGVICAIGMLMCAIFMFLAQVNRIFRIAGELFILMSLWGWITSNSMMLMLSNNPVNDIFNGYSVFHRLLLCFDCIILLVAMLELSRRCYASAVENCSRTVRCLALGALLSIPLAYYIAPDDYSATTSQLTLVYMFITLVCMSDAMLPTHSPVCRCTHPWKRGVAYLQSPGVGQSTLVMVLMMLLYTGIVVWLHEKVYVRADADAAYTGPSPFLYPFISMTYLYVSAILLTDLSCKRSNINRPVICFGYIMTLMIVGSIIALMVHDTAADVLMVILPGCLDLPAGGNDSYVSPGIALACCITVLSTIMYRKGK